MPTKPTTPPSAGAGGGTSPSSTTPSSSGSVWTWLLPVLTFLVGCALGALVLGVGGSGGDEGEAAPAPTPTQEPEVASGDPETTDVVVRVPASCLEAADGALAATDEVDSAVAALRDLDARRLQEIVDRVQQSQGEIRALAERCQQTGAERLEDGALASEAPSASPTP